MRDLNDLYYFVQVVDHGGFAPAGRALGIPKSKLSRRIALLEEALGVRLIQRSSRRFTVTDIGQAYYQRCAAMLVEADSAEEIIARSQEAPQGTVRLSCPHALLDYQMGELFARFMQLHPRVQLHIESTNRRVDVIREGLDLALRVRFPPLEDSELVMKVLGESQQCLVASPALVNTMGGLPAAGTSAKASPDTLQALSEWPSISDTPLLRHPHWELQNSSGERIHIAYEPRMVCEDRRAQLQAVMLGIGMAQMPWMLVRDALEQGQLLEVTPLWRPRAGIVHAVFPSRRGLLPAVRALLDFLSQENTEPIPPHTTKRKQAGDLNI